MSAFAKAFVKAQKAFGPALKSKNNPAFRSKYADLGACIEAVIDALNDNGITLLQRTHPDDTGVTVETVLLHESGEKWDSGPLHVPASKQDPQGYGSALTYARRYSLMAACGIAPEDDDGNAASKPATKQAAKPAAETEPPKDMSPRGIAQRITAGVNRGDTENAAQYLAGLTQAELDPIWNLLAPDTQDALTAKWPEVA
jgi:hypothetical protein